MIKVSAKQISSRIGLLREAARILDDKQAVNIKILCVENQTSLCNYFIICEGRSSTHVSALADEVTEVLGLAGTRPLHTEGIKEGNWTALDYASVIIHIFDRASREFYNLENLWRDAKEIPLSELLENDKDKN